MEEDQESLIIAHKDEPTNIESSSYNIPIELPDDMELGGKIVSITLCKTSKRKTILRYFLYVITLFIFYLFNHWIPSLRIKMSLKETTIQKTTSVVIKNAEGDIEIVPLIQQNTSKRSYKVFIYRLFKYYYNDEKSTFCPCQLNVQEMTLKQIKQDFSGLDEDAVVDNLVFFGNNATDIPKVTVGQLLVQEILTPFYIFQFYSYFIWILDDYTPYAVILFTFSVISIALTLYETLQTRAKLSKMSFYEIPVHVHRKIDGHISRIKVSSLDIVPGDILEVPEGCLMPCDAILLSGSCVMNEAMLTGESIPIVKNSIPNSQSRYSSKEDKQYTLFSGTECLQTRSHQAGATLGLVVLTGFSTAKGSLIRTMLFPKPTDFKFYSDSLKFIAILIVMSILGLFIAMIAWINSNNEIDIAEFLIKGGQIITISVPPALPTCMQIGVAVALARLIQKQIYCITPTKINEAGRINLMCFDKTGTLTEEGLDLLGVRPVVLDNDLKSVIFAKLIQNCEDLVINTTEPTRLAELGLYGSPIQKKEQKSIFAKLRMFPSEILLEVMAVCHSLTIINNRLIGDPLDLKVFEETKWGFEETVKKVHDTTMLAIIKPPADSPLRKSSTKKGDIGIVRRFDFASKLQRMSVIVKDLDSMIFKAHIKGSPEKIRELCKPESIPKNFHSILKTYTEEGYRVLACASKIVKMNYNQIMAANRDDIENDFTFIGFIIMENRLKPITTDIIDLLHNSLVKTVMVTGDNVLTAISVARQCRIIGHQQRVYLGDLSERKVGGKDVIVWKDFELSENRLTENLEPELELDDFAVSRHEIISPTALWQSTTELSPRHQLLENEEEKSPSKKRKVSIEVDTSRQKSSKALIKEIKGQFGASQNLIKTDVKNRDSKFYKLFFQQEEYCLAITGSAFSLIYKEACINNDPHYQVIFQKLLQKCLVYARMQPDEKALMIKCQMQYQKKIVGMCGDGANDVGALKTANAGVSLSTAEASIAAPFTSNIQDISCIPALLREGKAALAISFQSFKFIIIAAMIEFIGMTIMYCEMQDFTLVQYCYFDILLILPLAFCMTFSGTNDELTKDRPIGRLISVPVLLSVIGQGTIQAFFQVLSVILLKNQMWYKQLSTENFNSKANYANTTLYLLGIFQYLIAGLVYNVGKPFRKPAWTNWWFTITFIVLFCINLTAVFNPWDWSLFYDQDFWNLKVPIPTEWTNTLVIIIIINSFLAIAWESLGVKYFSQAWKAAKKDHKYIKAQQQAQNTHLY